jgi:uroporphyrinogen-III decarboxylase
VITADDAPEKVYDLQPPDVDAGQLGAMLDFTTYFVERTSGRYPIALTDMQGPLDTAYLVWDPCSFMTAMYTHPREVHHLMRLVTDLTIRFVREQRARSPEFIPCHHPALYLPDGEGLAISEDVLAVIGADLYREFALPYNNELSEEFGGLFIHSCGSFVHQFDNLARIRDLRGLNFGVTEHAFAPTWERFGGKVPLVTHLGLNKDIHFDSPREYVEHVLTVRTSNRGLCVLVSPPDLSYWRSPERFRGFVDEIQALVGA